MKQLEMFRCSLGASRIRNKSATSGRAKLEAEMIWTCAEEGGWIHWTKHAGDGAACRRKRRRTERRFMKVEKEEHAMGRVRWRQMICRGDPHSKR